MKQQTANGLFFNRLTYLGEKRASDAKVYEIKRRCTEFVTETDPWTGQQLLAVKNGNCIQIYLLINT